MVVAVFHVQLPELEYTLQTHSELSVRLVELRSSPSMDVHGFYWISGIDHDRLEDTLSNDPSVTDVRKLVDNGEQFLYRIGFDHQLAGFKAYQALLDHNGSILEAVSGHGTWEIRVFFPSHHELSAFYDEFQDIDLNPRLEMLHVNEDIPSSQEFGLTESQRNTLIAAAKLGYFSVPKDISLVELADHLGVSDQAVSERLRRGTYQLIQHTILAEQQERNEQTDPVQVRGD